MKFRRNQPRSQPIVRVARFAGPHSWLCFIPGAPLPSSSVSSDTRRCHAGAGGACSRAMSAKISPGNALKRPTKGGITTESFGTEVTTGPGQEEMPIHAHLSQSNYYLIV